MHNEGAFPVQKPSLCFVYIYFYGMFTNTVLLFPKLELILFRQMPSLNMDIRSTQSTVAFIVLSKTLHQHGFNLQNNGIRDLNHLMR